MSYTRLESLPLPPQAEARAHRPGQRAAVLVLFLVARGTGEEGRWLRVVESLERVNAVQVDGWDGGFLPRRFTSRGLNFSFHSTLPPPIFRQDGIDLGRPPPPLAPAFPAARHANLTRLRVDAVSDWQAHPGPGAGALSLGVGGHTQGIGAAALLPTPAPIAVPALEAQGQGQAQAKEGWSPPCHRAEGEEGPSVGEPLPSAAPEREDRKRARSPGPAPAPALAPTSEATEYYFEYSAVTHRVHVRIAAAAAGPGGGVMGLPADAANIDGSPAEDSESLTRELPPPPPTPAPTRLTGLSCAASVLQAPEAETHLAAQWTAVVTQERVLAAAAAPTPLPPPSLAFLPFGVAARTVLPGLGEGARGTLARQIVTFARELRELRAVYRVQLAGRVVAGGGSLRDEVDGLEAEVRRGWARGALLLIRERGTGGGAVGPYSSFEALGRSPSSSFFDLLHSSFFLSLREKVIRRSAHPHPQTTPTPKRPGPAAPSAAPSSGWGTPMPRTPAPCPPGSPGAPSRCDSRGGRGWGPSGKR